VGANQGGRRRGEGLPSWKKKGRKAEFRLKKGVRKGRRGGVPVKKKGVACAGGAEGQYREEKKKKACCNLREGKRIFFVRGVDRGKKRRRLSCHRKKRGEKGWQLPSL